MSGQALFINYNFVTKCVCNSYKETRKTPQRCVCSFTWLSPGVVTAPNMPKKALQAHFTLDLQKNSMFFDISDFGNGFSDLKIMFKNVVHSLALFFSDICQTVQFLCPIGIVVEICSVNACICICQQKYIFALSNLWSLSLAFSQLKQEKLYKI